MRGIRAVLFDVYGTLVCSGAGDISLDQPAENNRLIASLLNRIGHPPSAHTDPDLAASLNRHIEAAHHRARTAGIAFPEVDILEIWNQFFQCHIPPPWPSESQIQCLAVEYECRVNPVWPMPHWAGTLDLLYRNGLPLGLVSNAQFYTPIMLEEFLGCPLPEAGFHPALLTWSYRFHRAKPSVELFLHTAHQLAAQFGITPRQTVFVGNDMLKDIWCASQVGFRTVLFAGDQRSLRQRKSDPRCHNLDPDSRITDLAQLPAAIGLNQAGWIP